MGGSGARPSGNGVSSHGGGRTGPTNHFVDVTPFRGVGGKSGEATDESVGAQMLRRGGLTEWQRPFVAAIQARKRVSKEHAAGILIRVILSIQQNRDVSGVEDETGLNHREVEEIARHVKQTGGGTRKKRRDAVAVAEELRRLERRAGDYRSEIAKLNRELDADVKNLEVTPQVRLSLGDLARLRQSSFARAVADVMSEVVPPDQIVACLSPECRQVADDLMAEWGIDETEAAYRAMYRDPCGVRYKDHVLGTVDDGSGKPVKARIYHPKEGAIEATSEAVDSGDGLPIAEGYTREDALRRWAETATDDEISDQIAGNDLTNDDVNLIFSTVGEERALAVTKGHYIRCIQQEGCKTVNQAREVLKRWESKRLHLADQPLFTKIVPSVLAWFESLEQRLASNHAEQSRRDLEAAFLKAAAEFRRIKPWTRRLFPFVLDLRLIHPDCSDVRVEVLASQSGATLGADYGDDYTAIYRDYGHIGHDIRVGDPDPMVAVGDYGETEHFWEDRHLRGNELATSRKVILCAMLAVIDLLTREVRLVDKKREVKKKIHPEKCVPPITYNYRPVIYAPKTITVTRTAREIAAEDRAKQKREAIEAERIARQQALEAAQRAAEDQTAAEEIERLAAQPRPRVKHLVPCHIRRVHMSLKQQFRLAQMMATGWTPIDAEGREIPFPKDGNYTIVMDHIRGSVEPEVVSRRALTAMLEARK